MSEVERLQVVLDGDTAPLAADLAEAERLIARSIKTMAKQVDAIGRKFSQVGRTMSLAVTAPLTAATAALVKMASDAEETSSKFGVVYSRVAAEAQAMADSLDKAYGLSATEAQRLLGNTGDLLTGFGFTQKAALDMAAEVNKLAVDLASFTNIEGGTARASEALTKALLGERESIKSLGIAILEEDVKRQMAINTAKGLAFATERQASAYATLQLAQQQSTNAIGDYARTSDSLANQFREFKGDIQDVAVAFGQELLPYAKAVLEQGRAVVKWLKDLSPEAKAVGLALGGMAAAAGPVLVALGTTATLASAVVTGFSALSGVAATLAPVAVAVAGVAAAAAGLAYWLVGPEGLTNAWNRVTASVSSFVQQAIGFMANFRHNVKAIVDWLPTHWMSVLQDVGRMWVTYHANMIK